VAVRPYNLRVPVDVTRNRSSSSEVLMSGTTPQFNVLLVATAAHLDETWSPTLTGEGHSVSSVFCVDEARARLRMERFDVVVVDVSVDGGLGARLAHDLLGESSRPEVILVAVRPKLDDAVALAKAGAFDYVAAPLSAVQLAEMVRKAGQIAASRRDTSRSQGEFDDFMRAFLVSSVPAVQEMASTCRMISARPESSALVVGETGSGKNLVSRVIHWLSPQAQGPMIALNLVDATDDLEDRLFGSSITGKDGLLLAATGGSLLLHEIGELPARLQPRLYDVLDSGVLVNDLGGPGRPVRTRLIATTTSDLEALVDREAFHGGLYFRLASVTVRVPPLRERAADVPRIAEAILAQVASDAGRPELRLSAAAVKQLVRYNWPGNLREMRNMLTRIALLCANDLVGPEDLMRAGGSSWPQRSATGTSSGTLSAVRVPGSRRTSSTQVPRVSGVVEANLDEPARAERERIEVALQAAEGHRERAAALLGMSRTTLWTRMCVLGIEPERYRRNKVI
jgi:DNA-binding NtrC family response regulator